MLQLRIRAEPLREGATWQPCRLDGAQGRHAAAAQIHGGEIALHRGKSCSGAPPKSLEPFISNSRSRIQANGRDREVGPDGFNRPWWRIICCATCKQTAALSKWRRLRRLAWYKRLILLWWACLDSNQEPDRYERENKARFG